MTTDEHGAGAREDGGENFLSRWSRRKVEARNPGAGEAAAVPVASVPPASVASPGSGADGDAAGTATPVELPPVDSLKGLEGDYAGFLKPEVDDALRRSALKKLFADPHFNVIDVNEAYSGDWATASPVPAAALAMMEQVKHLLVDPDETNKDTQAAAPSVEAQSPDDPAPAVAAVADASVPAAQSVPGKPEASAPEDTRPDPSRNTTPDPKA